jgi:carboxyl-terminal processing protease
MPHRNLIWLLVVPGLVGLGLAVGLSAPDPDAEYKLVRQFVEVMAEVDANYVRELTPEERQKFVEDAINGGLQGLDRNSVYLNEKQLQRFEKENEGGFDGVGFVIGLDEQTKRPKVLSLFAGSSAYNAGLVVNDVITKVDGHDATGLTIEQASERIKGERGTNVTLTVARNGGEFSVTMTRGRVAIHPVAGLSRRTDDPSKWHWFADPQNKIAIIRVHTFSEPTTREVEAALREIEEAGGRALVLDLRENPGGLLTEAIKLADLFLTEGKIVTTRDRRDKEKTRTAEAEGTMFLPPDQKPVVVLVNHDSASASEIVAAALQDNGRAVVVGERSYGKGSVQSIFRLAPDGKNAVKLTTQTWWRPSGKNMDKGMAEKQNSDEWGVSPDEGLAVPLSKEEYIRFLYELDKLDYVAGKPEVVAKVFGNSPPPPRIPVPKNPKGEPLWDENKPFSDPQLNKALDYLRKKLGVVGAAPLPGRGFGPGGIPA